MDSLPRGRLQSAGLCRFCASCAEASSAPSTARRSAAHTEAKNAIVACPLCAGKLLVRNEAPDLAISRHIDDRCRVDSLADEPTASFRSSRCASVASPGDTGRRAHQALHCRSRPLGDAPERRQSIVVLVFVAVVVEPLVCRQCGAAHSADVLYRRRQARADRRARVRGRFDAQMAVFWSFAPAALLGERRCHLRSFDDALGVDEQVARGARSSFICKVRQPPAPVRRQCRATTSRRRCGLLRWSSESESSARR
jgi:uncharacterized protein YbaR (Trm112 family)